MRILIKIFFFVGEVYNNHKFFKGIEYLKNIYNLKVQK
jgi:hypothetical protein